MSIIGPDTMGWAIAFGVLLVVVIAIVFLLRSRGKRRERDLGRSGRRLSVVETREIDEERKLLIIRCDGAYHLLLVGGGSDLLIKADLPVPEVRASFPAPLPGAPSFAAQPFMPAEPAFPATQPLQQPHAAAPAFPEPTLRPPVPPVAGRPEPPLPVVPSPELQAFAPARAAMPASGEVTGAWPDGAGPTPAAETSLEAPSPAAFPASAQADFSEMTKKLEEALLRTAALRNPNPADRVSASPASTPDIPAAPRPASERDLAAAPADPFEEEIRRLLGRDVPKS